MKNGPAPASVTLPLPTAEMSIPEAPVNASLYRPPKKRKRTLSPLYCHLPSPFRSILRSQPLTCGSTPSSGL
jgi:hypothetical protein